MPGKPKKPPEQMFELLAYKSDGTFFSWYRLDANELLRIKNQPYGMSLSGTWTVPLGNRLAAPKISTSYLDMPTLVDERLSVKLLSYKPATSVVELHRDNQLVALASLHHAVEPKDGARFARFVKRTLPTWHNAVLTEDLLTTMSQAVLFLVQAPSDTAHTHWLSIYEGTLLMMAAYCRDEP